MIEQIRLIDVPKYTKFADNEVDNGIPNGTLPEVLKFIYRTVGSGGGSGVSRFADLIDDPKDNTKLRDYLAGKADLIGGKVDPNQLPAYVSDIQESDTIANLPNPGIANRIYIITGTSASDPDKNKQFRWSGTQYTEIYRAPKLYSTLGNNEDGGVTQKLFTDNIYDISSVLVSKQDKIVANARKSWYVENVGQTVDGNGSIQAPFKSFSTAIAFAVNGDTIYYTPTGTYNTTTNRAESTEALNINKNVTVVCNSPIPIKGDIVILYGAGDASYTNVLRGFSIAGRCVLCKQKTNPSTFILENCEIVSGGYIEHFGIGTDAPSNDTILLNQINAITNNSKPLLLFNENNGYGQGATVYINGGTINLGSTLADGQLSQGYGPNINSKVIISYNVDLRLNNNALTNNTTAGFIVDNRATGSSTPYTLPQSSSTLLGGIKLGNRLVYNNSTTQVDVDTSGLGGTGTIDETNLVHKTGDETIANGVKTFNISPIVPTPTTAGQAANKNYVDTTIANLPISASGGKLSSEYTISQDGAQSITLPSEAKGVEVVYVNDPVNSYSRVIYPAYWSYNNNILSITSDAAIKAGFKVIVDYKTLSNNGSTDPSNPSIIVTNGDGTKSLRDDGTYKTSYSPLTTGVGDKYLNNAGNYTTPAPLVYFSSATIAGDYMRSTSTNQADDYTYYAAAPPNKTSEILPAGFTTGYDPSTGIYTIPVHGIYDIRIYIGLAPQTASINDTAVILLCTTDHIKPPLLSFNFGVNGSDYGNNGQLCQFIELQAGQQVRPGVGLIRSVNPGQFQYAMTSSIALFKQLM